MQRLYDKGCVMCRAIFREMVAISFEREVAKIYIVFIYPFVKNASFAVSEKRPGGRSPLPWYLALMIPL
jgi:hypothetical protein